MSCDEGSESIPDQDTQINHLTLIRADNGVTIAIRRGCWEEYVMAGSLVTVYR